MAKLSPYYHIKTQLDQMVDEKSALVEQLKSKIQYTSLKTADKIDLKLSDKTMYFRSSSDTKPEETRTPQAGCGKARPIENNHESVDMILELFRGNFE